MPCSNCRYKHPNNHFLSNIIIILHTNSTSIQTNGPQEEVVAAEVEAEAEEEEDKVVDTPQEMVHLVFKLSAAVLMQEPTVLTKFLVIKAMLHLKIRWVDPL